MDRLLNDEQIIQKIQTGDFSVLTILFERNSKTIQSYIKSNNGQNEDAEDVLSESITIFYENVCKGKYTLTSKIDTYIYSVCQNLWLKKLRKDKRIEFDTDKVESYNIFSYQENEFEGHYELTKLIQDSISKMGKTCKDILQYFYFEGFDNTKIATLVGMNNADTVKAKKYQCMKELEKTIKKEFRWEDLF